MAVIDWPTDTSTHHYWMTGVWIGVLCLICLWNVIPGFDFQPFELYIMLPAAASMMMLAVGIPYFGVRKVNRRRRVARETLEAARLEHQRSRESRREEDDRLADLAPPEVIAAIFTLHGIEANPDTGRDPQFARMVQDYRSYGFEFPHLIIDRRIADEIEAIECPDDLLELEQVESRRQPWVYGWFVAQSIVSTALSVLMWPEYRIGAVILAAVALHGIWLLLRGLLATGNPSHLGP